MPKYPQFVFFVLILSFFVTAMAETTDTKPVFVGYEGCQMCHRDEYADWRRSKHAKAFELLKPGNKKVEKKRAELDPDKDYTTNIKCLPCHTTGYRESGGFINTEEAPTRIGVGCEMCHGPGSEYRKIHKAKPLTFSRDEVMASGQIYGSSNPDVCNKCHKNKDAPMNPGIDKKYVFNLEERLKNNRSFHKFYKSKGHENPDLQITEPLE